MRDGFHIRIGKDTITPALNKLRRKSAGYRRKHILKVIANDLVNEVRNNIVNERQYDGKPMRSPAKNTKCGGRFAASYKWRYRKKSRIPVDCSSKQLQDTGGLLRGIGIISVNADKAIVGGRTGHARAILSYHNPTRKPAGISKEFAKEAQKKAMQLLTKGV
jgi:hypothetical protein